MNAASTTMPNAELNRELPPRGHVAMLCLIIAEAAIFTIFIVAYIFYIGKSLSGPTPKEVLSPPIFFSICLLSSSVTIHFAGKAIRQGNMKNFKAWWFGTIALGAAFLYGTATEWHRLIYREGLTISTNLFGTTYYSLVGLHGFHVIVGLILLFTVMVCAFLGSLKQEHAERVDVLSLYWHFVDCVWIVVFTVVYIIGR